MKYLLESCLTDTFEKRLDLFLITPLNIRYRIPFLQ